MKIRSASLLDLGGIEQIYREADARFSEVPPPARLWSLVSQTLSALLPLSQETLLYVAEEHGELLGFVQASGTPLSLTLPTGKISTLQILNLCVADPADEGDVAPQLIEHLTEEAGKKGIQRLFVRLPPDDPLTPVFRMEGFRQYATESVLYADEPAPASTATAIGARPARGRDTRQLYHLYRKVTPLGVAQLEAPTFKDWKALRDGPGQQFVLDRVELVAWARIQRSSSERPNTLAFMALPDPEITQVIADHALVTAGPGAAWCSLRHYDSLLIDALRARGFTTLLTQALLVREATVRVPVQEKGLVPSFG